MKRLFTTFFLFSLLVKWPSVGMRIGFEFQLEGALCSPWSLHQSLQKREMFWCGWSGGKLWHVELDGTDIEYVTEPYALDQDAAEHCINSILEANQKLEGMVQGNPFSIADWYCSLYSSFLSKDFFIYPTSFLWEVCGRRINQIPNWKARWQPQLTIQHQLSKTISLCRCLFDKSVISEFIDKAVPNTGAFDENSAIAGLVFLQTHALQGVRDSFDYPLNKDTAFLKHVAIAVSKIRMMDGDESDKDLHDLLKKAEVVKIVNDPRVNLVITSPLSVLCYPELLDYFKLSISPQVKCILDELLLHKDKCIDSLLLMHRTLQDYNFAHQFDAKRWTHFMSRRPFNIMYQDIIGSSDQVSLEALRNYGTYANLFNKSTRAANFSLHTNHAEQFYDESLNVMNLEWLVPYFPAELQGALMSNILKEGLLSSHMLSCIDVEKAIADEVISNELGDMVKLIRNEAAFYQEVLSTVQFPKRRCFLDIEKHGIGSRLNIKYQDDLTDAMSPLFPLDLDDAMGRYRESSDQLDVSTYGSAIIEFRSIQYVENPRHKGKAVFLTDPVFLRDDVKYLKEMLCSEG